MSNIIENHNGVLIATVFVLLFAVIWNTLKRSSIFPENICLVLAVCVSLLCIIGLFNPGQTKAKLMTGNKFFIKDSPTTQPIELTDQAKPDKKKINFILLPYAALAISILFALILLMLQKGSAQLKKLMGIYAKIKRNRNSDTVIGKFLERMKK
jgi:hypothetical protein